MGRMSKLLRCLAGLFILCFIGNAFAAGYNCPTYRKYTSCNSGYYISECDGNAYRDGELMQSYDLTAGNSCKACPSGYSCQGGLYCPDKAQAATYQIQFNLNGGSGDTSPLTCTVGQTCDLYFHSYNYLWINRAGYVLIGWSTTPSNPETATWTVSYSSPGSYTYYAVWEECPAGTYKDSSWHAIDACQSCPTPSEGFEYNSAATAIENVEACQQMAAAKNLDSDCTNGVVYMNAISSTTWKGSGTTFGIYAKPGGYIGKGMTLTLPAAGVGTFNSGYDFNNLCTPCSGPVYSAGGMVASCTACPTTLPVEWRSGSGTGWDSYTDCYVYRNATSISSYCASGQLRRYASSASAWSSTATESTKFRADPGAYVSGSGINMTCTRCSGAVYSAGGDVTSCTACPTATSGWTQGTGTGWSGHGQCFEYRDATSISSYCASGRLLRYASSATAWAPTASEYTTFRAEPGAYVSGSGINMTCAQCGVGTYSSGGDIHACTACPTVTSGFEYGNITGMTSYTQCMQQIDDVSRINHQCSSGTIRQYADSATSWGLGITGEEITAAPGAILDSRVNSSGGLQVTGEYDVANLCTECGVGTYSAGGNVKECTACPELTPGFEYTGSAGASSYTQCAQGTNDPSAANQNCMADDTADTVAILQTASSPTRWNGPVLAVGVAAKPGAILDSQFQDGTLIIESGLYPLSNMCTICTGNTYSAGGTATSCTSCNRDYTISGTALTNHDSASDCKITCSGGEYVPTAGDGCVNVGVGYWGAGGTVSQTSTLGRNECASGLTTIGSGLGADEAGDCGRVLNVGDEKIYLRSTKKTTPSLNISINGDVFYGNMSTATKGSLRINSGGTTYSVYDDSM